MTAAQIAYNVKLRDPRWQARRMEIIRKAGFRCEDCGRVSPWFEVHHCCYIRGREPWEYDDELLMALCHDCHQFRQGREEALHIVLGMVTRHTRIAELEGQVWDAIHDGMLNAACVTVKFGSKEPI